MRCCTLMTLSIILIWVEIVFQGKTYTWSNMQDSALFQKLDWVFTSTTSSLSFLDTKVVLLARPISNHITHVIQIST
jgi:hypothetical protein